MKLKGNWNNVIQGSRQRAVTMWNFSGQKKFWKVPRFHYKFRIPGSLLALRKKKKFSRGPLDFQGPGGCFTNVSRALQNILSKFWYCRNSTCDENVKLKLCTSAQSHALGTRTKFQLEILTVNVISGVVYFRDNILESSRNVSETTPRDSKLCPLKALDVET